MKMRVGGILIFAVMMSSVAAFAGDKEQELPTESQSQNSPLAGIASALCVENMESLHVTAGVSDALTDTASVAVVDTGLDKVGQAVATADGDSVIASYTNLGAASVEGALNVRKGATTDSEVVGKMTNRDVCEIIETEDGWAKIESGRVKGYVKAEYLLTGEEALRIAREEVKTVATVQTTTLRVRKEATTDSATLALVGEGEDLVVKDYEGDWYQVEVDDQTGYVSGEYVELSEKLPTANTITEIKYGDGVSDIRVSLVQYALQFVGNRYVWGGTSLTNGVDCSGFTMQVYAHYGIGLPHHSGSQPAYGTRISASAARPGDLFFYGNGGSIGHVGIYIGNGQIVHASNARTGIKVSNAYYRTPVCVVSYLP
ncbi:MAG: NlpC/P60 family protein [Roseburia sp.]|nr:NlpC/P60 family protein [Roseburia sp.]